MLKPLPHRRLLGFSLVELMIGITIMAIVISVGMPSYSTWIRNTRIRTVAESIQNGLQMARAEAVKRNAAVQFVLSDDASAAWVVGCVTVNSTCPADIQSRTVGEGSSSDIIVETDAGYTVVFNNFGTVNTSPVPLLKVKSTIAVTDRELWITIRVGGNIRMCDPSPTLSSTDPRKC